MILDLPVKFDANEWWVMGGVAVLTVFFILLPKHFPPVLTFVLLLFTANVGITGNFILATEYPFNAYDSMDKPKYDLFDFIMDMINYSIIGYIFMYFYDRLHKKAMKRLFYIVFWICLSLFLEWISVLLHVFKYIHWNLWYSFFAYIAIFMSYILFLHFSKYAFRQYRLNPQEKD